MEHVEVEFAIQGGVVVSSKGMERADVLIRGGLIHDVVSPDTFYVPKKTIDASGSYVLPGIVDAHQHPVYSDRIDTISKEAAVGGTTTIVGFVGALKAWGATGTLVDSVKAYIEEGERESYIDFSAHGSLSSDDLQELDSQIPQLVELGVTSYKGFMAYKRRGMKLEDEQLLRAMEVVAENGALFQVHAENGELVDYHTDKFKAAGLTSPEYWTKSSPPLAEAESVLRIATLASAVSCPLYIVHLSSGESLDVLRLWKEWGGQRIYTETCPHFLTLTDSVLMQHGSLAKVAPPLRNTVHIEALWVALSDGNIDVVSTDFGGHTKEKKRPHFTNIFEAPAGVPGVGNLLEIVYHAGVNTGRITLPRLVDVLCEKPAKIFGMYPKKGVIQRDADADVVVFDPSLEHTISTAQQQLHTDYNLWEGWRCVGYPSTVIQRGRVIAQDGALTRAEPYGEFVPRASFAGVVE